MVSTPRRPSRRCSRRPGSCPTRATLVGSCREAAHHGRALGRLGDPRRRDHRHGAVAQPDPEVARRDHAVAPGGCSLRLLRLLALHRPDRDPARQHPARVDVQRAVRGGVAAGACSCSPRSACGSCRKRSGAGPGDGSRSRSSCSPRSSSASPSSGCGRPAGTARPSSPKASASTRPSRASSWPREWLHDHAHDGLILIDDSVNPVLTLIDADLDRVAAPFSGPRWVHVLRHLDRAEWVYVDTGSPQDQVARAVRTDPNFNGNFVLRFTERHRRGLPAAEGGHMKLVTNSERRAARRRAGRARHDHP